MPTWRQDASARFGHDTLVSVDPGSEEGRSRQEWLRLIVAIYGPTLLASIGFGAIIPLVALQASALGAPASGWQPSLTGLSGVALLIFDLPAGGMGVAARVSEPASSRRVCWTRWCWSLSTSPTR